MTRHSQHFVAVLVFALSALGVPEAVRAQDAGTQEAQGLERVLRATEGLPAAERDEILGIYQEATTRSAHIFHFYDPACIALGYGEWRRENRDVPGDVSRLLSQFQIQDEQERVAGCADRDRIVSSTIERAEMLLASVDLTQDQISRLATCTAELVADRFLENPRNRPSLRYQSDLYSRALRECRQQHGGW